MKIVTRRELYSWTKIATRVNMRRQTKLADIHVSSVRGSKVTDKLLCVQALNLQPIRNRYQLKSGTGVV